MMSMKPGETIFRVASIRSDALRFVRFPIAMMRSPLMPTSAPRGSAPVPSITVPPDITTSNSGVVEHDENTIAAAALVRTNEGIPRIYLVFGRIHLVHEGSSGNCVRRNDDVFANFASRLHSEFLKMRESACVRFGR